MDGPVVMSDDPPKLAVLGFWVGVGTSQILIVIMTCTLGWSEMTAYIVMVFGSLQKDSASLAL